MSRWVNQFCRSAEVFQVINEHHILPCSQHHPWKVFNIHFNNTLGMNTSLMFYICFPKKQLTLTYTDTHQQASGKDKQGWLPHRLKPEVRRCLVWIPDIGIRAVPSLSVVSNSEGTIHSLLSGGDRFWWLNVISHFRVEALGASQDVGLEVTAVHGELERLRVHTP